MKIHALFKIMLKIIEVKLVMHQEPKAVDTNLQQTHLINHSISYMMSNLYLFRGIFLTDVVPTKN